MTAGFYFRLGERPVDWESPRSIVLANPEWIRRESNGIAEIERRLPALAAHVWVATSGTSSDRPGRVRWIALSKAAFLSSAAAVNLHLASGAADVWAHALPIFHVGGLGLLARAWLSGATVVPAVEDRWDASGFHEIVTKSRATLSALVPSQVHDLVAAGVRSPPSMRAIVVGGARLEPALYQAARVLGWPCLPSYGLTETCSQVATAARSSTLWTEYPVTLPVLSHAEIRVTDGQRLEVRTSSLLTCCAELAEDDVLVWDPKRDGWLVTDDVGRVSDSGVEVFGRASELVKVLGELVSLPRLEQVGRRWADEEGLTVIPGFDLAVVALPHGRLGHELVMALAKTGSASLDTVRRAGLDVSLCQYFRDGVLPFERIQRVAWVERIPRTSLGKCQRALLACQVSDQARADL